MPDPSNPFAGESAEARQHPGPYHPKAIGLQGEMLDAMIKAAFTEGANLGQEEGFKAAQAIVANERPRLWDEAYDKGYEESREAVQNALQNALSSHVAEAVMMLRKLAGHSRIGKGLREDAYNAANLLDQGTATWRA